MGRKTDALTGRMKGLYEKVPRTYIKPNEYYIIRLDGKAFHTYTKGFEKPFDSKLVNSMDEIAKYLCAKIDGALFAYVQSDEVSILVTHFDKPMNGAWYKGAIQKITSVSASMATVAFNRQMLREKTNDIILSTDLFDVIIEKFRMAEFDSRIFSIGLIPKKFKVHDEWIFLNPKDEVGNYFVQRQKDCIRNSISMTAQNVFSHKQLHGKSQVDCKEMLKNNETPWEDLVPNLQNGRFIFKERYQDGNRNKSRWTSKAAMVIQENRDEFMKMIPDYDFGTPTFKARAIYFFNEMLTHLLSRKSKFNK